MSKIFSSKFCLTCILTVFVMAVFSSCSYIPVQAPQKPEVEHGLPEPEVVDGQNGDAASPGSRVMASHSLTLNGYKLLKKKDYDGAIRILERAVGINPVDGPGYYYLAEAWIGKKNYNLASHFNDLAFIYLRSDEQWLRRAEMQKKKISHNIKGL